MLGHCQPGAVGRRPGERVMQLLYVDIYRSVLLKYVSVCAVGSLILYIYARGSHKTHSRVSGAERYVRI